jgi:hypothetical protein
MSEQYRNDWGSPATLGICHHHACPCCNGSGQEDGNGREPAEYSLVIVPRHLRNMKTVPVLRLYDEELESLVNLISEALTTASSKVESEICEDSADEASVSFRLTRNRNGQLGEYSLKMVGRGVNDVLPVDGSRLQAFVEEVSEMKEFYEADRRRLAEKEDREREAKSRMKGKTLDEIEAEAKQASPFMAQDEQESEVVRVLLVAAFFVGPNIDRLVSFTGYSRDFIAEISIRMHDSGLWADGEACIGHWFDDEFEWTELGLRQDCLVASGDMVKSYGGENGALAYQISGRAW